mmetsp:Transcript_73186/g.118049  ORF Transcript_73186/g.118049 Transcript_73186/m.118049 type:complete len:348 (-) Transcript_73186:143-1186(-)
MAMADSSEQCKDGLDACAAAKAEGNTAYAEGDLDSALERYAAAMELWEEALRTCQLPKDRELKTRVRYSKLGFGMVMSAFPMFDEYFLKDLGTDQAIWAGDPGGELQSYPSKDLIPVSDALWDLRFALAQNLAAVCLKRSQYTEAVKWADAALAMDGKAPKALMRLGAALLRLGKPGPASDRLSEAAKAMPGDVELRKLLREAEMKRAPTWVCASGCCGPWGIVCGGPIVSSMPEVVPPRLRPPEADAKEDRSLEEEEETEDGQPTTLGDETASSTSSVGDLGHASDLKETAKVQTADLAASLKKDEASSFMVPSASCRPVTAVLALLLTVGAAWQLGPVSSGVALL